MGRWCPFIKGECNKECVFYRRGLKYRNDGGKPEPFEECAINIAVDCLENLVLRQIGIQKATEQARNEMAKVGRILWQGMVQRADTAKVEVSLVGAEGTGTKALAGAEARDTVEAEVEEKAEEE